MWNNKAGEDDAQLLSCCSNSFAVNKMRLKLISGTILGQLVLLLLLLCCNSSPPPSPSVYVLVGQDSFFQWLASILWPSTATTPPPVAVVTPAPSTSTMSTSTPATATQPSPSTVAIDRECISCRCGLINTLRRIVGGQETQRHQYPWMTVVQLVGRYYCGGSLISDLYVLTAAHCVQGVPPELITLRFLEHNRSDSDATVLQRGALHVKTHELYNPRSYDNDIAIIQLDRPLSFEAHMRPVCLPVPSASFDGEVAVVTGWGALREGAGATDTLQVSYDTKPVIFIFLPSTLTLYFFHVACLRLSFPISFLRYLLPFLLVFLSIVGSSFYPTPAFFLSVPLSLALSFLLSSLRSFFIFLSLWHLHSILLRLFLHLP